MEDLNQELEQELEHAKQLRKLKSMVQPPAPPEGYFAQLEAEMMQMAKAEQLATKASMPAFAAQKGGKWQKMAIAASFLLAVSLAGLWYMQRQEQDTYALATHDLSADDAEAYLSENLEQYELTELIADATELLPCGLEPMPKPQNQNDPKAAHQAESLSPTESEMLEDLTDEDLEDLL
jgi:hypothetical protein